MSQDLYNQSTSPGDQYSNVSTDKICQQVEVADYSKDPTYKMEADCYSFKSFQSKQFLERSIFQEKMSENQIKDIIEEAIRTPEYNIDGDIQDENIVDLGEIGQGGFSEVHLVMLEEKNKQKLYALKKFIKYVKNETGEIIKQIDYGALLYELQQLLKIVNHIKKQKNTDNCDAILGQYMLTFSHKITRDRSSLLFEIGDMNSYEFLIKNKLKDENELLLFLIQNFKLSNELYKLDLIHTDYKLINLALTAVTGKKIDYLRNFSLNYIAQLKLVDIGSLLIVSEWIKYNQQNNINKNYFRTERFLDQTNKYPKDEYEAQFFSIYQISISIKTLIEEKYHIPIEKFIKNDKFLKLFTLMSTPLKKLNNEDKQLLNFDKILSELQDIASYYEQKNEHLTSQCFTQEYIIDSNKVIKEKQNQIRKEYCQKLDQELNNQQNNTEEFLEKKYKSTKNNIMLTKYCNQYLLRLNTLPSSTNLKNIKRKLRQLNLWVNHQKMLSVSPKKIQNLLLTLENLFENESYSNQNNVCTKKILKLKKYKSKKKLIQNQFYIQQNKKNQFKDINVSEIYTNEEDLKLNIKYVCNFLLQKAQICEDIKEKLKILKRVTYTCKQTKLYYQQLQAYYLRLDDCITANNQKTTCFLLIKARECLDTIIQTDNNNSFLFFEEAKYFQYMARFHSINYNLEGVCDNLNKSFQIYCQNYRNLDCYQIIETSIEFFNIFTKSWNHYQGLQIVQKLQKEYPFLDPTKEQSTQNLSEIELKLFKQMSWGLAYEKIFKGRFKESNEIILESLNRQNIQLNSILSDKNYFNIITLLGRSEAYSGNLKLTYKLAQSIEDITEKHPLYNTYICEVYYILSHVEAVHQNFSESFGYMEVLQQLCEENKEQNFVRQAKNSYNKHLISLYFIRKDYEKILKTDTESFSRRFKKIQEIDLSKINFFDNDNENGNLIKSIFVWHKQYHKISASQDLQFYYILFMIYSKLDLNQQNKVFDGNLKFFCGKFGFKVILKEIVRFYEDKFQNEPFTMDYLLTFMLNYFRFTREQLDIFKDGFEVQLNNKKQYPNLINLVKETEQFFKENYSFL